MGDGDKEARDMPRETTDKIPTTVWLRPAVRTAAQAAAAEDDRSLSVWVERLILKALSRRKPSAGKV